MDAEQKAQEYVSQPVNFGSDTEEVRIAEYDAFIAGWHAARDEMGK